MNKHCSSTCSDSVKI